MFIRSAKVRAPKILINGLLGVSQMLKAGPNRLS